MNSNPCPPQLQFVELYNGCKVAYSDTGGTGPALLFVHGLGAYGGSWQKNTTALSNEFRCICLDLPGNGCSQTGDYPYTMDFFARSVIDFIGRLGLRNLTIVGHSMGAQISMTAVLMEPACCDRLVLCAPAGFERFSMQEQLMYNTSLSYMSWFSGNEQAIHQLIRVGFHKVPVDVATLLDTMTAIADNQPARHYKLMTERCITSMLAEPVYPRLGEIRQPALVIFGEQDAMIPNQLFHPLTTRKLAVSGVKRMQKAELIMLPNCGHMVMWECANAVNEAIRRFVD